MGQEAPKIWRGREGLSFPLPTWKLIENSRSFCISQLPGPDLLSSYETMAQNNENSSRVLYQQSSESGSATASSGVTQADWWLCSDLVHLSAAQHPASCQFPFPEFSGPSLLHLLAVPLNRIGVWHMLPKIGSSRRINSQPTVLALLINCNDRNARKERSIFGLKIASKEDVWEA